MQAIGKKDLAYGWCQNHPTDVCIVFTLLMCVGSFFKAPQAINCSGIELEVFFRCLWWGYYEYHIPQKKYDIKKCSQKHKNGWITFFETSTKSSSIAQFLAKNRISFQAKKFYLVFSWVSLLFFLLSSHCLIAFLSHCLLFLFKIKFFNAQFILFFIEKSRYSRRSFDRPYLIWYLKGRKIETVLH